MSTLQRSQYHPWEAGWPRYVVGGIEVNNGALPGLLHHTIMLWVASQVFKTWGYPTSILCAYVIHLLINTYVVNSSDVPGTMLDTRISLWAMQTCLAFPVLESLPSSSSCALRWDVKAKLKSTPCPWHFYALPFPRAFSSPDAWYLVTPALVPAFFRFTQHSAGHVNCWELQHCAN